ncbi:MAG: WYL domain-containing protein [Eubacteriales bacterium]|nr:WYL domain-containing protein [Eubacteriales bacterium]
MFFSELYGAYYNTVAAVLREAVSHPVSDADIRKIIEKHAFGESIITIPSALRDDRWKLIKSDGTTPIVNKPTLPLTLLQKRWLKAISNDPRVRLFSDDIFDFPEVEPLFLPSDYVVFDKYSDGDDYTDEKYIANFRMILDAIRKRYPLSIETLNRKGKTVKWVIMPEYLEYSEKDDKFRLIGYGSKYGSTVNLGRIVKMSPYDKPFSFNRKEDLRGNTESVVIEVNDKRNALERVLMHFAHFEKESERIGDDTYTVRIKYDREDETEMVIRILSFGPMIKVTAPQHFIDLIRERLSKQKSIWIK